MTYIHPAIIEKQRREREEREGEALRLPLYVPRPMPVSPPRNDESTPAPERGVAHINFTL